MQTIKAWSRPLQLECYKCGIVGHIGRTVATNNDGNLIRVKKTPVFSLLCCISGLEPLGGDEFVEGRGTEVYLLGARHFESERGMIHLAFVWDIPTSARNKFGRLLTRWKPNGFGRPRRYIREERSKRRSWSLWGKIFLYGQKGLLLIKDIWGNFESKYPLRFSKIPLWTSEDGNAKERQRHFNLKKPRCHITPSVSLCPKYRNVVIGWGIRITVYDLHHWQ